MSLHEGMQEVHGQVAAEIALLVPQIDDAVAELAQVIGAVAHGGVAPSTELVDGVALEFLARARPLLEGIADRLATDLPTHVELGPGRAEYLGERIRHFMAYVLEYADGFVDGGGVSAALARVANGPLDADTLRRALGDRLGFLHSRAEAAAVQWAQEVEHEVNPPRARGTPRPARERRPPPELPEPPPPPPPELPEPAPEPRELAGRGSPPEPPPEPFERVPAPRGRPEFTEAPTAGFAHPSLDRDPIPFSRGPDDPAERQARLDELMAFADELKVRVKKVPELPSAQWLDKMEAKLTEVAIKKGVAVPAGFGAPTVDFDTGGMQPANSSLTDEARRQRIDAMLEKAESAGLKLGRVPTDPSDAWLEATEGQLEAHLAQKKAEKKAERERVQRERKERIERLRRDATELGVDLGHVPPFPTDDWLARAEMRIAQVMLRREEAAKAEAEAKDEEVLESEEGEAHDEDDAPAEDAEAADEDASPADEDVDDDDSSISADADELPGGDDPPSSFFDDEEEEDRSPRAPPVEESRSSAGIPVLLYEEGTVQEEYWIMKGDTLSIGRARGSDVQILHDAGISRAHCAIERAPDGFVLKDLGSTKGTLVNGIRVQGQARLAPGATIQIGDTQLVFRLRQM